MFAHKYNNTSGYPTFWNSMTDSVAFRDDSLEITDVTNAVFDPMLQYKKPLH